MAHSDFALWAVEVDPDAYAETAAGDLPSLPRTFQSEQDYQAVRASYMAKQEVGSSYADLLHAIPELRYSTAEKQIHENDANERKKPKLGKKEQQLLGYAVGELYLSRQFAEITDLCRRFQSQFEIDAKFAASLDRWLRNCEHRM